MLIEAWQPDLVLGIGEGFPEQIVIEMCAHNQRLGQDTAGKEPETPTIILEGAETLAARLDFAPPANYFSSVAWSFGDDAGRFLCNNALYLYLRSPIVRAGFIHVPPQLDTPDAAYIAHLKPFIVDVLQQNLPACTIQ